MLIPGESLVLPVRRLVVLAILSGGLLAGCQPTAPASQPSAAVDAPTKTPKRTAVRPAPPAPEPESVAAAPEEAVAPSAVKPAPAAPKRAPTSIPTPDLAALGRAGIQVFRSKHLVLYSDVDPEISRPLPGLVDKVFDACVAYFGPLPEATDGSDFVMVGHLMRDTATFLDLKLLANRLPGTHPAAYDGHRFWMEEQQSDYYRRHLLFHEVVHCLMGARGQGDGPPWLMEGLAEHLATHRILSDGTVQLGVMPPGEAGFEMWGRIRLLKKDLAAGGRKSIRDVTAFDAPAYNSSTAYAWSWGLCAFLDGHPRTREAFHKLCRGPVRDATAAILAGPALAERETEWLLFQEELEFGYDLERAAIEFAAQAPPAGSQPHACRIDAARSWQPSGVGVEKGKRYRVTADGMFTVGRTTKPWESEPAGVSLRYVQGRPLGRLLAAVRAADDDPLGTSETSFLTPLDIGAETEFTAPASGVLYFKINDSPAGWRDNAGAVAATVQRQP